MTKHIWIPTTTTQVQVKGHKVTLWDDITMERRPLTANATGFGAEGKQERP